MVERIKLRNPKALTVDDLFNDPDYIKVALEKAEARIVTLNHEIRMIQLGNKNLLRRCEIETAQKTRVKLHKEYSMRIKEYELEIAKLKRQLGAEGTDINCPECGAVFELGPALNKTQPTRLLAPSWPIKLSV